MNQLKFIDYSESKYAKIELFHEGLAGVQNLNGLYGYIDKLGNEIIKTQYLKIKQFREGLAPVQDPKTHLWGYINKKGKLVIPYQYREANPFKEGYASVLPEGKDWVFIDKKGNILGGKSFYIVEDFSEGYARVITYRNSDISFINTNGEIKAKYQQATDFLNGFAVVDDGKNYYIINRNFETVSTISKSAFSLIAGNTELMFLAKKFPNYGFVNEALKEVIPIVFKSASKFSDGLARVNLSSDWEGYVTKKGKIIAFSTKYQYQELNDFMQGLALVESVETNLYGYINKNGEEKIKCEYVDASGFSEGLAYVLDIEGTFHYIDKNGEKKITIPQIYYSVLELDDKTIIISAETEEELGMKKLQLLSSIKSEIINKTINNIDQLAYNETTKIKERSYTRVRKPNHK